MHNPQYSFTLSEKTHIRVTASICTHTEAKINLLLVASGADVRETDFDELNSNLSSGQYFPGFAHLEAVLDPKAYTLVLSSEAEVLVSCRKNI